MAYKQGGGRDRELADAFRKHQAGQWQAAEEGYRRVLSGQPRHARCLHLLGAVLAQQRRYEDAIAPLTQATVLDPQIAEAHNNLGIALKEIGRPHDALDAYDAALHARPNYADAANNKGIVLQSQGRLDEAVACFARAADARPDFTDAWNNHGIALNALGRPAEAASCFARAVQINPQFARAHNNLGNALMAQSHFEEALKSYDCALRIDDTPPAVHSNRGMALKELSRFDEARASLARALQIDPAAPDALSNLATCLLAEGCTADALEAYGIALSLDPQHADARWNRALALLGSGDWTQGWPEYEWRFQKFATPYAGDAPRWDGTNLSGDTILVCAEQGAGDTLKFVRYLAQVQARGARVVFACPPALRTLMQSCPGIDQLAGPQDMPPHDYWVPLLSLPGLFGTTPETVPGGIPYLAPPSALAEAWQAKAEAAAPGAIKVGLCWAGSPDQKNDHNRSAKLSDFAPLAAVPGVAFFSLQKGAAAAQAASSPPGMTLVDLTDDIYDFADTAALMSTLDLIISVDTSVAHLAGALGQPVWTLLPHAAPWHYLQGRADCPWYPAMRLFRQPAPRDWAPMITQVTQTLLAAIAAPLVDNLIADGETAFGQNNRAQARACFLQALEIDGAQVRALNNLAVLDYADGHYAEALAWLERALTINPHDSTARTNKDLCAQAQAKQNAEMHRPRVSVIVPCYKQAHLLPEAVESVVAQSFTDWEMIIVNDGSPDNTQAVAQELIARYPQCAISLIDKPNGGLSNARNTGLKAALGEFILPLDSDDKLHPQMLEKTLAALESTPQASFAFTDVQHFGLQTDVYSTGPFTLASQTRDNRMAYCALMRRTLFDHIGSYDPQVLAYEDWDFWLRALGQGVEAVHVPLALFCYRKTAGSKLQTDNGERPVHVARLIMRHPALYDLDWRVHAARLLSLTPPPDTRPLVSVVVPGGQCASTLAACVDSVIAQSYTRWEIILVNDGARSDTRAAAQEIIDRCTAWDIRLLELPETGVAAARSAGINASCGDYFLPLNGSDTLHPQMLEKTLAMLQNRPDTAICFTDMQILGTPPTVRKCGPLTLEHCRYANPVAHCCLVRRMVFTATGGYSSQAADADWEFWLEALDKGFTAVHVPEPLFQQRESARPSSQLRHTRPDAPAAERIVRRPHLHHPSHVREAQEVLAVQHAKMSAPLPFPAADEAENMRPHARGRVLLAMNWFFPHVGGEEKLSEGIGGALMEAGFDVEVATRFLAARTHDTHRGMRIFSLGGNVQAEFAELVAARRPDCVMVIGGPDVEFIAAAAALPPDGPRVVLVPCINPEGTAQVHQVPAVRRGLEAAATRAQAVVTSSRRGYDTRLFDELGIGSVYVPNAVNATAAQGDFRARYGIPKDKPLLVQVGNLRPEKNHAGLLNHLRDRPGDWHLVLIGCVFAPTLRVATHARYLASLDPRITCVADAPPEVIAAALEEADLLLLPSLADATPLVLLEAMSHGLPWIATPQCGSAHDHAGGLMLPLDQFGPAIDFLLADQGARAALGAAGRDHWQSCYTFAVTGPRYAALIDGQNSLPPLDASPIAVSETEAVRTGYAARAIPLPVDAPPLAVSVVMTVHDTHGTLKQVLDAYAAQTVSPLSFEVLIVETRLPGARPFISPESYPFAVTLFEARAEDDESAGRNAALLAARGEIALLTTASVRPAPDCLEQHLRMHRKYPALPAGVMGRIEATPESSRGITQYVMTHTEGLEGDFDALLPEEVLDARALRFPNISLKREFLLACGLYGPEAGAQRDAELAWRLHGSGLQFVFCPQAMARALHSASFEEYAAQQTRLGRDAARICHAAADAFTLFWMGVHNAEDRLAAMQDGANAAAQSGAQLAALDKAGLSAVQSRPNFVSHLVPALGRLCLMEAERRLLTAYLAERDILNKQADLACAPLTHGPKVSVVVPCHNYARFLPDAIGSLIAQTYSNWEAVIVDDGSTDDTRTAAEALIAAHPDRQIRLISQTGSGHPSFARNRGIRETDSPYILCLDADDEIAPTFLSECVTLLEKHAHLSVIYSDQWRFTNGNAGTLFSCGDWHPASLAQYLMLGVFSVFRRAAWVDAGGWRAVGYEDWDFWMACAETNHHGLRIPKPLCRYRKHGQGKYETDKSLGYVNKAWLALNHPAMHDPHRLRWAWSVVDADRYLRAPASSPLPRVLVSIVLTGHSDDPHAKARAVQSIHAQTYPHWELIDRVGQGTSVDEARARALEAATGKYVAYLDAADQWTPEHLASLVGFLETTRYQAAYADFVQENSAAPVPGFDALKVLIQSTVSLSSLVHARACLETTGPFDTSLPASADWEFTIRLSRFFDMAHLPVTSVIPAPHPPMPSLVAQTQAMQLIHTRYGALTQGMTALRAAQQAALDALVSPPPKPKSVILTATVCRERGLDLYAACPCDSGKKLKFCHYNQPLPPEWPAAGCPLDKPRALATV